MTNTNTGGPEQTQRKSQGHKALWKGIGIKAIVNMQNPEVSTVLMG